ncbi:MAG: zinc-dependent metalloprotease [Bacteroidaceae bacterium]|nr:zinc-dependent metalloprotease [Bacteroidaceae bacterium]
MSIIPIYISGLLISLQLFTAPIHTITGNKAAATRQKSVKAKSDTTKTEQKEIYSNKESMLHISKEKDSWFFLIPDSLLQRPILAVTRFTATPAGIGTYGGEEIADQVVYFELSPDKSRLFLKSNVLYNHADSLDAIDKAVHNTSQDPIITAFKVEKKVKNAYRINVTHFLLAENCFSVPQRYKLAFHATNPVEGASYVERVHSYPINTEIRTVRTYNCSGQVPAARIAGTVSVGLNTSFVLLPKVPMRARIFDPRVGYFTDDYYAFSDDQQRVKLKRFVTRYRLEPKDEDIEKMKRGELVEPKKPIVYYIDPATPKKWRPYLIDGVKDWNKAFEKAGFKNAITAKEWPENDTTMSLEDARFSVIRYLASDIPNAYGPQVHDPRSGEIIESHVGWYHNVMSLVHDWYMIQASNVDPQARTMKFTDELMGQLIRFVSSHEIGHTLGLRHNFGSSSTVPVEKLRDKTWVKEHGHTPSIMDYARFNYVAQPEDNMAQSDLFPRVNDYDCWAIEWGYKPVFEATDSESDRYFMDKITTRRLAENPRLWWGDGEGYGLDPRCQTEDLGDDAVLASEYGIKNLKGIIGKLPEWTYWGDDSNGSNLTEMYSQLFNQFRRYCGHVRRYLSGTYYNKKTVNEAGNKFTMTPRAKEKSVLPFFDRHIFNEPTWLTNPSYIQRIYKSPAETYSILTGIMSPLVSDATLSSLNANYPIEEYLPELQGMLFKELGNQGNVSKYRRELQRVYVYSLSKFFNGNKTGLGTDATAYVLHSLQELQKKLQTATHQSGIDTITKAHYTQLADEINRTLTVR